MTPLQALERIIKNVNDYSKLDIEQELDVIAEALHTPTSDEVCEELERYFYQCVGKANPYIKYKKDLKKFVYVTEECNHEVVGLDKHGYINFIKTLPPYLISLIARFYEGSEGV